MYGILSVRLGYGNTYTNMLSDLRHLRLIREEKVPGSRWPLNATCWNPRERDVGVVLVGTGLKSLEKICTKRESLINFVERAYVGTLAELT